MKFYNQWDIIQLPIKNNMSEKIEINNTDLFIYLSEKEQEAVSAGYNIFSLQFTKEMSFVKNQVNILDGGKNISMTQEAGSMFSQLAIFIGSSFSGNTRGTRRNRSLNGLLSLLSRLF